MNLIEYTNYFLNDPIRRQKIIAELDTIQEEMEGYGCYEKSLRPGKATSFLVYCLNGYYLEHMNQKLTKYLEIGCLYGHSLSALAKSGFNGTAYGIDLFTGYYGNFTHFPAGYKKNSESHKTIVENNVLKFGNCNLKLMRGSTQEADFDDNLEKEVYDLDVLLIDGDHSYEGCKSDYNKMAKYVKKGGILLFDNYEMGGVKKAVSEGVAEHPEVQEVGVWKNTTWVAVKK
jgi:SAM-dependent methyltransferase